MSQILYGKPIADRIAENLSKITQNQRVTLASVGFSDAQWVQYVSSLKKSGEKLGIEVRNIFCDGMSAKDFCATVRRVSDEPNVRGVIVEQPLAESYRPALDFVSPDKDIDCLNHLSVAKMYCGTADFYPATPLAVLKLFDGYGIGLKGKNVTIVGRGNAVGKPLSLMLLQRDATITVCHTKTVNLPDICRRADIIVSACGKAGLITADCVTENTIAIDVGLSFSNGKTCGDISPEACQKVFAYSPVPGGVGPITRMVLFENMFRKTEK